VSLADQLYRAIARNIPNGAVFVFDRELRYILADGALMGGAQGYQGLLGKRLAEVVSEENLARLEPALRAALAGEERDVEMTKAGRVYSTHVVPVRDERGRVIAAMVMTYDVTAHKRIERRLQEACARLDHVISSTADAMWSIDRAGRLISFNPAYTQLHEWLFGRAPSVDDDESVSPGSSLNEWGTLYVRALQGERITTAREFRRGTERRTYEITLSPLMQEGKAQGVSITSRDVTLAVQTKEASLSDELTGLRNRRGFLAAAERQLEQARGRAAESTLFFIDLDGMKAINDQLGHDSGDAALKEAAGLLRSVFREADTVARLGGDEFVVLAACEVAHAASIEARLRDRLARLNAAPARRFALAFSVGTSRCAPQETRGVEDLLRDADASMYEQKRARRAAREDAPPRGAAPGPGPG
jgi:diguanylate cyclase (GGDEF)-like protein/PAS domain S-box-containing protein